MVRKMTTFLILTSEAAIDAKDSCDMSLTWSISEKWTFFGLIFPSSSDSVSLLLGSGTSKLGFLSSDLRGVVRESDLCFISLSSTSTSIIVGSSTELEIIINYNIIWKHCTYLLREGFKKKVIFITLAFGVWPPP